METLVWVEGHQVANFGFAIGQEVTWPMSRRRKAGILAELVGAVLSAQVAMGPDWFARRPEDTVDHTGTVTRIESFRCRLAEGHVVPGSVLVRRVDEAVFAGSDEDNAGMEDGVNFVGYLVMFTDLRPT